MLDPRYKFYVDIPGHQTPAGGTLPPQVTVSVLKPNIVIIDKIVATVKKVGLLPGACQASANEADYVR